MSSTYSRGLLSAHHRHRFPPLLRSASRTGGHDRDFVDAGDCQDEADGKPEEKDFGGSGSKSGARTSAKNTGSHGADSPGGDNIDGGSSGGGNKADPETDEGEATVLGALGGRPTGDRRDVNGGSGDTARARASGIGRKGHGGGVRTPRDGGASGRACGVDGVSPTAPRRAGVHGSKEDRDRFPPLPSAKKQAPQRVQRERGNPAIASPRPLRSNQARNNLDYGGPGRGVSTGLDNAPDVCDENRGDSIEVDDGVGTTEKGRPESEATRVAGDVEAPATGRSACAAPACDGGVLDGGGAGGRGSGRGGRRRGRENSSFSALLAGDAGRDGNGDGSAAAADRKHEKKEYDTAGRVEGGGGGGKAPTCGGEDGGCRDDVFGGDENVWLSLAP